MRPEVLNYGLPYSAPYWSNVDWGEIRLDPTFVSYADEITVNIGDFAYQVKYVGKPAPTTNDSYMWIPNRRVLISGDLMFSGGTPFMLTGSVRGAISVLEERIKPLGAQIIITGHGPISGSALINYTLGYLRYVQDIAERGRAGELTPLQAAREFGAGPYADLLDVERLVGNLHRAYAEQAGIPQGAPINVLAALSDMVTFNGGKPSDASFDGTPTRRAVPCEHRQVDSMRAVQRAPGAPDDGDSQIRPVQLRDPVTTMRSVFVYVRYEPHVER